MPERFEVKQEDRTYRFYFAEPAFELSATSMLLERALYPVLLRHGFRLSDIQLDSGSNLAQMSLRCLSTEASVVLFLDRVEVWLAGRDAHRDLAAEAVRFADTRPF